MESIKNILEQVEGGIFKRIDENRELVELIEREAPDVFQKFPWVLGWLRSQDKFLLELSMTGVFASERCRFKPSKDMPRNLPLSIK